MNNQREQKQNLIELAIEEYINAPIELKSLTKIGEKYGIRRQTLSTKLKERGIEIINYQNRIRLNDTIFDSIDTEEKAYWLGFIFADGNISSEGNRLEIRLSVKDLDHLEKFRQFIKLENPIRTGICNGNGYCHLSVRNKHLWETLNSLGCTPCKSLTLQFPKISIFNNKSLIYDFIRGYVDGDGCLSLYKKQNSYCTELNLVGTKSFLESVNSIFGNVGFIKNKTSKNYINNAYSLQFSNFPSRVISRILYSKANIYLNRKYDKFLEFCRLEEESSRRLSSNIGEGCDANTEIISKITKGLEIL